jgi:predicted nuclease of restriction endonuclease-like (RecB) superfamily
MKGKDVPGPIGQCLGHIREILRSARNFALRTVNTTMVVTYWHIGREIVEEEQRGRRRADYGEALLQRLSLDLRKEFGKGFSIQNLRKIRQFYLVYRARGHGKRSTLWSESQLKKSKGKILQSVIRESPTHDENGKIRSTVSSESATDGKNGKNLYTLCRESVIGPDAEFLPELSWSHYQILTQIEDATKRRFYEVECSKARWSVRELERQVSSLLFERLARSRDKKGLMALANKGNEVFRPEELIKDPYVLEFTGLPEAPIWQESDLEQALIDRLRDFLLELGKDLFFVARQKRITIDGDHFYIDLVFYHRVLRCYLLIDLKVGRLTQADIGQMLLYAGYFETEETMDDENPPIGLILCTDKNDAVVRYTLGQSARKVFASRYQLHLPSEEELTSVMIRERRDIERNMAEEG